MGSEIRIRKVTIFAVLFLAAVGLATLTLAVSDEASRRVPTTLTIASQDLDLSGKVKSPRLGCLGGRNVRLYKQVDRMHDPSVDQRIATDTSERQGNVGVWSTGDTGIAGKFYVRASRTLACKAGTSGTIRARR